MNAATPADVIEGRSPWCLVLGDGVAGVAGLTDGTLDAVVTDPPYNVAREGGDCKYANCKNAKVKDFGEWDRCDWSPILMLDVVEEKLRKGGTLLSFTSDRLISAYRQHNGLKQRGTLVWEKLNPAPHPRPCYVQATEYIIWAQRDGKPPVWNGNGYTINVLKHGVCSGDERTSHPTQKPESLITELILRHTNRGEIVCDPYSGSGTTGVVCRRLGRRFIGFEMDMAYYSLACQRLEKTREQLTLDIPAVKTKQEQVELAL